MNCPVNIGFMFNQLAMRFASCTFCFLLFLNIANAQVNQLHGRCLKTP
jgi:hypothetical protein